MSKFWILCANTTRGALFSADSAIGPLTQLEAFENPDARLKDSELADDRQARVYDSKGQGRHAVEPDTSPKEREQLRFAHELVQMLEKGRVDHAFEKLVLVAAPGLLGMLRDNLHAPLKATILHEFDKDYTMLDPQALRARLPERL